jgi:hypothetical protein
MNISVSLDTTPCSRLEVNRHFWGTYLLHLFSCWFIAWLILRYWKLDRNVSPKRWLSKWTIRRYIPKHRTLLYFPCLQNLTTSSYSSLHVDSVLPQFHLIFFLFYCCLPTGLSLQSSNRIFCRFLNVYMPHWFQLPLFDCPNTLEAEEAYTFWNTSICKFLNFSLLRPHIPLTTHLWNTIN